MSSLNDVSKQLENLRNASIKIALPLVSKEFLRDTEKGKVPILTGALRKSAWNNSNFNQGKIVWDTSYAWNKYNNGSFTGVKNWDSVTMDINQSKYEKMISNVVNSQKNTHIKDIIIRGGQ